MGTGEKDYLFVGMAGFSDAGPRSPCTVDWFQLDADDKPIDFRRLYRTDDSIWGAAVHHRAQNGRLHLILALTKERVDDALLMSVLVDRYGMLDRQVALLPARRGGRFSDVALCDFDRDGADDLLAVWVTPDGDSSILRWDFNDEGKISGERELIAFPGQVIEALAPGAQRNSVEVVVQESEGCRLLRLDFEKVGAEASQKDLGVIAVPKMGRVHGLAREGDALLAALRRVRFDGEVAVVPEVEYQGIMIGPDVASLDSQEMSRVLRLDPQGEGYGEPQLMTGIKPGRSWATAVTRLPKVPEDKGKAIEIGKIDRQSKKIIYVEGLTGHFFNIDQLESFGLEIKRGWVARRKNTTIPPAYKFRRKEMHGIRAVVLADTPLWALTYGHVRVLDAYVRQGGTLVFCEGPMTGIPGGYAASSFVDLLPSRLGPAFGVTRLDSPQVVDSIGRVRYVKALGPLKKRVRVLAEVEGHPVLVEHRVGRGHVLQVAALPLGLAEEGEPDFWQSEAWIQWLEQWITKH